MAYNEQEAVDEFIGHLKAIAQYWANVGKDKHDATDGLAFSTLSLIDGCSGGSPGFDLIPVVHPSDRADTYAPYIRGKAVNKHSMMHERFHSTPASTAIPLSSDPGTYERLGCEIVTHGRYVAVRSRLRADHDRESYVVGPREVGRPAPIASFWRWEDAVRWAKDMSDREVASEVPAGDGRDEGAG